MTGCQADYGDDRHCGNCKSLANDLPVQEVIIDRLPSAERSGSRGHQVYSSSATFRRPAVGGFSLRGVCDLG